MDKIKTGECFFIDETNETLWVAISYQDELGLVWTENIKVE